MKKKITLISLNDMPYSVISNDIEMTSHERHWASSPRKLDQIKECQN